MKRSCTLFTALASHYPDTTIEHCATTDHECTFVASKSLRDPDVKTFRSTAPLLNDLGVAHRLSVAFARGKFGFPSDSGFAIKSISTIPLPGLLTDSNRYNIVLRWSPTQRRSVAELGATVTRYSGFESYETNLVFTVLPAALVRFVRHQRNFTDYRDVAVAGTASVTATSHAGHVTYSPAEADRLTDGERADHVPALVIIDIIFSTTLFGRAPPSIFVSFLRYLDPRDPFCIRADEEGSVSVNQGGVLVARMTR